MLATSAYAGAEGDPQKAAACNAELDANIDICVYAFQAPADHDKMWSCIDNSTTQFGYCMFAAGYREESDTVQP